MPGGTGTLCFPFGPSTCSESAAIWIFTPFGSGIGFFPTRDIALTPLPDVAQNFAAHAFFPRRRAGHHPARRRQDIDPQPAQHARHLARADVNAASGARNALDPRDYRHVSD